MKILKCSQKILLSEEEDVSVPKEPQRRGPTKLGAAAIDIPVSDRATSATKDAGS